MKRPKSLTETAKDAADPKKRGAAIDKHVGERIRRRRRLLGLTQRQLGEAVGVRLQQIQKYESAANRVSASRLFELAEALDVQVKYFYEGLSSRDNKPDVTSENTLPPDILSQKETLDLVQAYYKMNRDPRREFLELTKALDPDSKGPDQDDGPA